MNTNPAVVSADNSLPDHVLRRLQKLEEAVFNRPDPPPSSLQSFPPTARVSRRDLVFTSFGSHLMSAEPGKVSETKADLAELNTKLPPLTQARILLEHFAVSSHRTSGFLHIPSCRNCLEIAYEIMRKGETPNIENISLLFGIFAGAAFHWSPSLLQALHATRAEARAAFSEYSRLGLSIVDNVTRPLTPSTTALTAMANLNLVTSHARGLSDSEVALRMKCYGMARALQIDRLDTPQRREERARKGCNMIEVEIQRRVWWHLVASDWLNAFSGGHNDGAYFFQPRYMNVRFPSNIDDDALTPTMVEHDVPLSIPSAMSVFIQRAAIADVCRQVVDALPSQFHPADEVDYDIIMKMDFNFRRFLHALPFYLKVDAASVRLSSTICKEHPAIAMQRLSLNCSVRVRLCRLHRPYYLEGLTNPKYAYSHTTCIQEAQTVLELRRAMDEYGAPLGMNPARSWVVIQHVSIAALILATDVSWNPKAPNAADRMAKVLATCDVLEKSIEEAGPVMEGVKRNMQLLKSTMQETRSRRRSQIHQFDRASDLIQPSDAVMLNDASGLFGTVDDGNGNDLVDDQPMDDWDKFWTDFIDLAPELDMAQWDLLFEDIQPAS